MFKKIKFLDILLIFIIVILIGLVAHFSLIARNQFLQFIYPIEAIVSKKSIHCSSNSPKWMEDNLLFSTDYNGSLANQLVYISPNGGVFHCENGWKKLPIFSQKVDKNIRYRYASLTKPITASLILNLRDNKKLKLNDKLVTYLPELKFFKDERIKNITLENLLTHTSGFDRLKSNDPLFNTNERPWCPYDLKKLKTLKLDQEPGTLYAYDNRNYCLLGVVVERVTGEGFRQVLNQKIFLKNFNIKFIDGPFLEDEVNYDFRNESFFVSNYINMFDFKALSAVAGLSGSAESYAKLLNKLLRKKNSIVSISSIDINCKIDKLKSCFTLGLSRYKKNNNSIIVDWHDGGLPGANSLFIYDENGGITVWMGNGSPSENVEEYGQFKKIYSALNTYYRKKV